MSQLITTNSSSLHAKLAKIQGDLPKVLKEGVAKYGHVYKYLTESQLIEAVQGPLAEAGISRVVSCELLQFDAGHYVVKAIMTLTDSATGESIQVEGVGASDGDKAIYKAQTGASKYALYKCFGFSSGDDPEAEGEDITQPTKPYHSQKQEDDPAELEKMRKALNTLQQAKAISKPDMVAKYGWQNRFWYSIASIQATIDKINAEERPF